MQRTSRRAALAALLIAAPLRTMAQVSVNENAEKLEALKEELEKARQLRDKVIAKRWEDKRADMDARAAGIKGDRFTSAGRRPPCPARRPGCPPAASG